MSECRGDLFSKGRLGFFLELRWTIDREKMRLVIVAREGDCVVQRGLRLCFAWRPSLHDTNAFLYNVPRAIAAGATHARGACSP